MAHTILIREDGTTVTTIAETIMQRDKLVNKLAVICPKTFNGYDVKDFDLAMMYKTPISKTVRLVILSMTDENYKENYYKYTLAIDTDITAENGDVEVQFTLMRTYLDENGTNVQQVKGFAPINIHICQLSDWLVVADPALNTLAELYLTNKNMMNGLEQLATTMYQTKVDDIKLDAEEGTIYGTANGVKTGQGITLEELNSVLVETGGETSGNIMIQHI